MQVMVPGKTHLSLTVAWALDHDSVATINAAANSIPEDDAIDVHHDDPVVASESDSALSTPQQRPRPGSKGQPDSIRTSDKADAMKVEASSKSTSALQGGHKAEAQRHRQVIFEVCLESIYRDRVCVVSEAGTYARTGSHIACWSQADGVDDHAIRVVAGCKDHVLCGSARDGAVRIVRPRAKRG